MNVKKCLSLLLTALLTAAVFTACGRWDYSREAVKAANDAQGDTPRVEFKVNQTFTSALRAAAEDNIQPNDVDNAMTMDKSIEKLLTSGYRLDVYALRADIDADQAAAQLADEFVNRLAGCEDEGFISMVKADNGYFYEAVLVYKHGGNSGSGSGSGDEGSSEEPEEPNEPWVTYSNGTLTFLPGASEHIGDTLGNYFGENDEPIITEALRTQAQWTDKNDIEFENDVESLIIKDNSGIEKIGFYAFSNAGKEIGLAKPNTNLKRIQLSDEVESIESGAFQSCTALFEVTGEPDGTGSPTPIHVSSVGSNAFVKCAFTQIAIQADEVNVYRDAFSMCNNLKTVTLIGESIACISNMAGGPESLFLGCSELETVELRGSIEKITEDAFADIDWNEATPICNSNVTIKCTGGLKAFVQACPGGESIEDFTDTENDEIKAILNKVGIDSAKQIQSLPAA